MKREYTVLFKKNSRRRWVGSSGGVGPRRYRWLAVGGWECGTEEVSRASSPTRRDIRGFRLLKRRCWLLRARATAATDPHAPCSGISTGTNSVTGIAAGLHVAGASLVCRWSQYNVVVASLGITVGKRFLVQVRDAALPTSSR